MINPIQSILRSAHCRTTHHYFALDALPLVQTDAGMRLTKLLLKHYNRYLMGAIDPDVRFRDYQNHVIHVTDGYWGGAPRVAHKWYDRMQRYLREQRYSDAAHAAGVVSHYFTDPLQPLHTKQCDRERVLHRPIEWTVSQNYKTLFQAWKQNDLRIVFELSDGPGWLGEAILHSARFSHRRYNQLLDEYDLIRGIDDPRQGFPATLHQSFAELIGLAVTGWARVIERAARDAEANRNEILPEVSLTSAMISSVALSPLRLWSQHAHNRNEREAIELLVDEFTQTGKLRKHLPAEVDIVHRVVQINKNERKWKLERQKRLASKATIVKVEDSGVDTESAVILPFAPRGQQSAERVNQGFAGSLSLDDELIQALSIGAKTSERLAEIGIHNIREFLKPSPRDIAYQLRTYWITSETVSQWQSQAKLMCEVGGLKGRDAQLLAGAGYDDALRIATCDPETLHREVSLFATTSDRRHYLRGGSPPKLGDVKNWIENACEAIESGEQSRRSA